MLSPANHSSKCTSDVMLLNSGISMVVLTIEPHFEVHIESIHAISRTVAYFEKDEMGKKVMFLEYMKR